MKKLKEIILKFLNAINVFRFIRDKRNEKFNDELWEKWKKDTEKMAEFTGKTHWLMNDSGGLVIVNRATIKEYNKRNRNNKINSKYCDDKCLYKVEGKGIKRNIETKV